jgi:hypothetical protein
VSSASSEASPDRLASARARCAAGVRLRQSDCIAPGRPEPSLDSPVLPLVAGVFVFAIALLAGLLTSRLAQRTIVSTAVLFLAAGFIAGQGGLAVLDVRSGTRSCTGSSTSRCSRSCSPMACAPGSAVSRLRGGCPGARCSSRSH